jgi:urocanate hydratase
MVAANIAGAASLAATAGPAAGKQATRDGVADFLVTDLDEALRILKNQIRKREAVAVCVAAPPKSIEQQMLERGVLPDLIRGSALDERSDLTAEMNLNPSVAGTSDSARPAITLGGSPTPIAPVVPAKNESLLTWCVNESPAQWLPRLDVMAIECLVSDESPSAQIARRWLRFAPRYLGRLASNVRVLRCPQSTAYEIANRMRASVQSGEIPVPVRIENELSS